MGEHRLAVPDMFLCLIGVAPGVNADGRDVGARGPGGKRESGKSNLGKRDGRHAMYVRPCGTVTTSNREANMVVLSVKAKPGAGLQSYAIEVDGTAVTFGGNHEGTVPVDGACGDNSGHRADYYFYGPAGKTLGFTIKCGSKTVAKIVGAAVPASTAPNAADYVEFEL
jgi:hypothetical protein